MTTPHPLAAAILLTAAALVAGCAPDVIAPASTRDGVSPILAAPAPAPAPTAVPCLCPAPQVCDGTAGPCICPDAPADVDADCLPGERIALCGDALPPPCRRAHSANAEHVACCQD